MQSIEISPSRYAVVLDRSGGRRYTVVVCAGRQAESDSLMVVSGWDSCALVMFPGPVDDEVRAALERAGWTYDGAGVARCPVHA